ncbi:YtxH domain-containing protein [Mastigocladopsis repens]|uniref:YtxH domain-containing protein n=1 Tax=Mastigocladopsis repens TaxID=221287 RepID=UPI00030C198D|nr:YtxH domain-containing protein [Mastigocladopsis repens]
MSYNKQPIDQHHKYADRIIEQRKAPRGGMGIGGGLVGAAIGGLLGRRVGGVSGAVMGAVAGALVGKGTAERVNRTVDSLVDAAKSVAETVNHNVNGVGNALKDTVEEVKPSVVGLVKAVQDTVEEAKPSVVGVVKAVQDTVEEAKPSVVGVVKAVKDTVDEVNPSVVGAAKNVAEAVNYNVISVGNALKDTIDEVKQSVIGVEETLKDTDEPVKPFGNHNHNIHQEQLVTEHPLSNDVISSLSNSPQYEDSTPLTVSLPAPPPPTPPLATHTGGDFFIQELGVEFPQNSNSPNEPDSSEQVAQGFNDLQQSKTFQEIDIKELKSFQDIDIKDIEEDNIQHKEKEFEQSQSEKSQQLRKQNIKLKTDKIPKVTGIILGVSIITLMGVALGFNPKQNPLVIKSSASSQSLSAIPETTPETTPERSLKTMTDGWIFIGNVNQASNSLLLGKPLIKSSQSTDSSIVPSVGSIVTVTVKPGVTLRDNKPQAPRFSHQKQKALAILKPQEKLKILKVEFVTDPSTTQPPTRVWAKVHKCGSACL